MSTIEANTLKPISGSSTLTLGESGDTVSLGTGVTAGTGIGTTINNNADNRVITGSGTANTLEGESNLTYSSPDLTVTGGNPSIIHNNTTSGGDSGIKFQGSGVNYGFINLDNSDGALDLGTSVGWSTRFYTNNSEKMRITSGGIVELQASAASDSTAVGLAIGKSQKDNKRLTVYGSNGDLSGIAEFQTSSGSGDNPLILFTDGNNQNCGEITMDASANTVAYSTSSDYRLKENVVAISDGITRLKNLKPYRFNFITKPEQTVDGFFAHEAQTVVPEAVHGTKDAMKTVEDVVVNADGTVETWGVTETEWTAGKTSGKYASDSTWEATKEVIDRQGIDQSKIVPLLTAALKEAITKIETLEAKVAALESA